MDEEVTWLGTVLLGFDSVSVKVTADNCWDLKEFLVRDIELLKYYLVLFYGRAVVFINVDQSDCNSTSRRGGFDVFSFIGHLQRLAVVLGVVYVRRKFVNGNTSQQYHKNDAKDASTERVEESLAPERQLNWNRKQVRIFDQFVHR